MMSTGLSPSNFLLTVLSLCLGYHTRGSVSSPSFVSCNTCEGFRVATVDVVDACDVLDVEDDKRALTDVASAYMSMSLLYDYNILSIRCVVVAQTLRTRASVCDVHGVSPSVLV